MFTKVLGHNAGGTSQDRHDGIRIISAQNKAEE